MLGAEALGRELQLLLRELGWPSRAAKLRAFALIRSAPVPRARKYSAEESDFLNSFFIRDLGRSARAVAEGRAGKALGSHLAAPARIEAQARVDVRRDTAAVARALLPARFPAGRWPSPQHWPLVLSQQLAVNLAMGELAEGGSISSELSASRHAAAGHAAGAAALLPRADRQATALAWRARGPDRRRDRTLAATSLASAVLPQGARFEVVGTAHPGLPAVAFISTQPNSSKARSDR